MDERQKVVGHQSWHLIALSFSFSFPLFFVNTQLYSTELNYPRSVSRLLLPRLDCVFYHSKLTFILLLLLFFHRSHRSCWAIYFNPCHGMAYSLAKLGFSNFTIAMRWKQEAAMQSCCPMSLPPFLRLSHQHHLISSGPFTFYRICLSLTVSFYTLFTNDVAQVKAGVFFQC